MPCDPIRTAANQPASHNVFDAMQFFSQGHIIFFFFFVGAQIYNYLSHIKISSIVTPRNLRVSFQGYLTSKEM